MDTKTNEKAHSNALSVKDACAALKDGAGPYADAIVLALLEGLQNEELDRRVKPHALACLGDVADAIGPGFDKYLERVLPMIGQAAQTAVPDDDDELVEYLNELRECVLEVCGTLSHSCYYYSCYYYQ